VAIFGSDYPTPDGTCIRDYIHLADLVSAHLLALGALESQEAIVYNLGSGHGYSVLEVIEMARKVTGHPIPALETPRRPGDPASLVASPARIRKELGWEAKHSALEVIISSAWEWHRKHPHGYPETK
jgi:UDP-glucose 4-epimerase